MISQVTHTLGPFCLLQCLLQEPCLLEILEKVCQRDTSSHHTFPIIYLSNILTISLFTPCNILPLIDPQKFLTRDLADAVGSFQKPSFLQSFWIQIIWINWWQGSGIFCSLWVEQETRAGDAVVSFQKPSDVIQLNFSGWNKVESR